MNSKSNSQISGGTVLGLVWGKSQMVRRARKLNSQTDARWNGVVTRVGKESNGQKSSQFGRLVECMRQESNGQMSSIFGRLVNGVCLCVS